MNDAPSSNTVPAGQFSQSSRSEGAPPTPPAPRPFDALSYLKFNAARTPDAPAVWEDGEERSFRALRDQVYGLIARLPREGIAAGDVVAALNFR